MTFGCRSFQSSQARSCYCNPASSNSNKNKYQKEKDKDVPRTDKEKDKRQDTKNNYGWKDFKDL